MLPHLQNQMARLVPRESKGVYRQPCVGFFMRNAQLQPFYGGLGEATSVGRSFGGSTNFVQFTTS